MVNMALPQLLQIHFIDMYTWYLIEVVPGYLVFFKPFPLFSSDGGTPATCSYSAIAQRATRMKTGAFLLEIFLVSGCEIAVMGKPHRGAHDGRRDLLNWLSN